jgi:hypothetical protein
VRFVFAAQPSRSRAITVTWFGPTGRPVFPAVRKPNARVVTSFVKVTGGTLPVGSWRVVLKAGKVVKTIGFRVG